MKINKKYYIRRNLDSYSEIEFAKILEKDGYMVFYPFRDIGIDILAYKGRKVELYQLKARNEHGRRPNYYRFSIRKDIEKLSKYPNTFFILCALQPSGKFDFFKLPIDVAEEYFKEKGAKDSWLGIERINPRDYEIRPRRIANLFDINNYLI